MKNLIFTLLLMTPLFSIGQGDKLIRKALRTSDLNEKIILLNEAINLEPKNFDAYFLRGLAKNDLGDFSGAIVDYSRIIAEQPDADSYYNRGNSKYSLKNYTGAKEDYAKAYILDENFIDAIYSLACVRYDLEEYEKAIIDFNKVIKAVPNQPKTYTLRANSYYALKHYKNAVTDYSTAILLNNSAENYYNRAQFYMNIKQYEKARADFTKATELNENNPFAYFYKGTSNLLLNDYKEAASDFSTVLKFDSLDFDAFLGLAIAHYNLKDLTKAKQYFDRANSILAIGKNITNINQYSNTYWFQNQYYFLNQNISNLAKLK